MTRTRWIGAAAILVVILAFAGYLGSQFVIGRMLETRGLRKLLSWKTAKVLDCDAGYLPLEANGRSVWSGGFLAKAEPPRRLTELRASSLWARSSLSELWRAKWRINVLHVRHLQAAYGADAAKHINRNEFEPPELYPPSKNNSPLELDIRLMDVTELDLYWGTTAESGGAFQHVHTQFFPRKPDLVIHANGGTFRQAKWPEAHLQQCKLFYAKPNLRIDDALLDIGGKGTISVVGSFAFAGEQSLDLQLTLAHCPIAPFFEKPEEAKVTGEFGAAVHLQKDASQKESARAVGSVETTRAILQKIATLEKVAGFTGRKEIAHLPIDRFKAYYDWNWPTLTVKNLILESKNLIIFEGEFVLNDQKLNGEFQLGVSPELVDKFPGAREEIFTRTDRGYLWTTMSLTGPLNKLRDNLKPRLLKAAQDHFAKGLLAPILNPGKSTIETIEGL